MGRVIPRGLSLLVVGLILAAWVPAQAAPQMKILQPERDLGVVIGGSLINQVFEVINQGDATLTITKLDND